MNATIQDTLLDLFNQVIDEPDRMPVVHIDSWQEYSEERLLLTSFRDMLECMRQSKRQAEEQLREREEQYRNIFEATGDGLFVIDLDGYVVEANPAACKQLGYTYEGVIGLHRSAIVHSDYHSLVPEYLRVIQTGDEFQGRAIDVRKDGTTFPVEVLGRAFTYKGRPHTLSVVRDITKQVQAEQQLREREEQYRAIFEASTDALIICDQQGVVVEVNPAACSMSGEEYGEWIGQNISYPKPFGTQPSLNESPFPTRDQVLNVPGTIQHKDGSVIPIEAHSIQFTYKGQPHILAIGRDISERVQAEQQLREKEEEYRNIFEASIDGLIIIDQENHIVEANPAACQIHGYTREGLLGRSASSEVVNVREIIRTGGQFHTREQGVRKDGTFFHSEVRGTPFTYKGKPHMLGIVRDITEQVEAEEQLREREEQYRSVFEATSDGLFITDFDDGHLVDVNPAAHKMHGYGYQEFLALHPMAFIHPDSHPLFPEYLQTVKAGGQFHAQALDVRKDGTIFPVEVYGTSFIYRGKPHVLGIVRDISERVEAEKQLREREEQYRSVFEATSDGLIIRDMDGYVVEANPAACSMHDYAYEEFIGLHRTDIIDPSDHAMVTEYMKAIRAGQSFLGQAVDLRKDGTPFPVEVRGTTFTYQGKPHTLSVLRDITERVEAEKQLREKEEQYRSIFEATSDAILIRDLEDGHVVEANPAACQMYGYSYEEFIGLDANVITHPDSLRLMPGGLQTVRAGQQLQLQGLGLRKDGTPIHVEVRGTPFSYKGKPHLLGVSRDITERVQAQQLLEQRVEERTRELASLLEVSHTVASTLQIEPLVNVILDQLKTMVNCTGASILTLEGDRFVILDIPNPTPEEQLMQLRFSPQYLGLIWKAMTSRELVLLPDVRSESPMAQALREAMGELMDTRLGYVRACLFVPLILKDQVVGMLVLTSSEVEAFTRHHATLAQAIANQAAVAIENARLYAQAQELAALEERQKLARELHDSVSQALYGISLGAHAARTALERAPGEVAEPLDYVLSLAEAALTEMRALIFELRPESLETEGLISALTKQAAATQARHELVVSTELCEEPTLSLHVKQEFYRVAQEAMHNIVKHAHASQVIVRLAQTDNEVVLEVRDNGRGFDTSASFPGHLGLHSMRERVANVGGTFEIVSEQGGGTRIRASIPT